jgi:hypothetical protein
MQNPIQKQNLFFTPESPDHLMEMLDNLPLTRAGIVQAACMAVNLCHEMVNNEMTESE